MNLQIYFAKNFDRHISRSKTANLFAVYFDLLELNFFLQIFMIFDLLSLSELLNITYT